MEYQKSVRKYLYLELYIMKMEKKLLGKHVYIKKKLDHKAEIESVLFFDQGTVGLNRWTPCRKEKKLYKE
jgi:hypothetical protein